MEITQFISELKKRCYKDNFKDVLEVQDILKKNNLENWAHYADFDDSNYKRNIIYQCDIFEVIIIGWKPNQKSPMHDHPSQGCLMKILTGNLLEKRNTAQGTDEKILTNGIVSYISNSLGIHQILNVSNENAVSLHIYSPGRYYK